VLLLLLLALLLVLLLPLLVVLPLPSFVQLQLNTRHGVLACCLGVARAK